MNNKTTSEKMFKGSYDLAVPFEINKVRDEHKRKKLETILNKLKNGISKLRCSDAEVLLAKYNHNKDSKDIDNVLFYNIRYASFNNIDPKRVILIRNFDFNEHEYSYEIIETAKADLISAMKELLWEFSNAEFREIKEMRPEVFWLAIKNAKITKKYQGIYQGKFGVKLELSCPKQKFKLINKIKPIFDGVISVLNFQEEKIPCEELRKRIKDSTEQDLLEEQLCGLVKEKKNSLLGLHTGLLKKHGNGLQWQPKDDQCICMEISIKHSDRWSLSGKVFSVE
ncbi:MAG: hypothetical protein KKA62_01070 [Nanoarchaeota archaeon]|nr:hypothetical protein [Nanoarchaeota archaeon]